MYAVIESGGKQHRVEEGEVLKLEKLDAATGDTVSFDKDSDGRRRRVCQDWNALVAGSEVTAEGSKQARHDKVHIIKFNRRKHSRKPTRSSSVVHRRKITGIKG